MFNNYLIRVLNRDLSKKLFTLVELIVVIVILAVLAAIAFMNISKWIGKSSNSRSASDVGTISRSIHSYYAEKGLYPETSKDIPIKSSTGLLLGSQGIFDEEVVKVIGAFNKVPRDPRANDYYMYTKIKNPAKGFEVGAVFENPEISMLLNTVYAEGVNSIPYVQTSYQGKYYNDSGTPIFPKPLSVFNSQSGKFLQESEIGTGGALLLNINNLTGKQLSTFNADGIMIGGEYGDFILPKVGYVASGTTAAGFSTGIVMQALPTSVTATSNIINGACGSNNGKFLSSTPSTNLCSSGNPSTVTYSTGMGSYTWSCIGVGGTTASCKAYDNYTKLLMHFNGNSNNVGANEGVVTNSSVGFGYAGKFGNSAWFSGVNYLTVPDSDDWNFGTNDFTMDLWINKTGTWTAGPAALSVFVGHGTQLLGDGQFQFSASNSSLYIYTTTNGTSWFSNSPCSYTWTNSQWYHVAVVRNGTTIILYVNGIAQSPTINIGSNSISDTTWPLTIGARTIYDQKIIGYMDELRISKGIARRKANFTPPTVEY